MTLFQNEKDNGGENMNKKFQLLTILLVTFLLLLSACSKSNNTSAPDPQESKSNDSATKEEITELNVAFYFNGDRPRDLRLVEEKVNEITKEKINATVTLMPIPLGDYQQQMNLMLSGNEKLDLAITTARMGFTGQAARGQFLELNDLLDQYGQDIKNVMDEDILNAPTVNGHLYGIPTLKDLAGSLGFNMRTDLVEKHGIDVDNIKTVDDLESVLRTIKENEPGIEPMTFSFAPTVGTTNVYAWFDSLGDFFGVLPNDADDFQLVNLYETPEYEEFVKKMRRWYTEGLIQSDITTTTESRRALLQSNSVFGWFGPQKPGIEAQETRNNSMPITSISLKEPMTYISHTLGIMWSIPRNTTAPEKAMELLNLMYVDEELVNLLNWGIEGEHYVKVSDNIIKYPDGVDRSNVGYSINMSYLWGNSFLTYIFEGDDPDLWNELEKFNENATKSKALGFVFDPSPVSTELSALNNIRNEYHVALEVGVMDPERHLPEFNKRLKDAGIDKYIAEKQRQFDEWRKNN